MPWRLLLTLLFLFGCHGPATGQNPQLETKNGKLFATVVFTSMLSSASPPYYSIAIDSTGNATYESAPRSDEQTGVPYTIEFVAPAPIRDRVFRTVQQLNFLKLPAIASNTIHATKSMKSIKTLAFREGNTDDDITYRTCKNPLIRKLTVLFQNISTTMEFGRRVAYLHRQRRSRKMDVELKQMQSLAQEGRLEDLPAVAPVLRHIADDRTLDNTARTRAEAILDIANGRDAGN
jgi:hypothetical protein